MHSDDLEFMQHKQKLSELFEECGLTNPYTHEPIRTIEGLVEYVNDLAAETVCHILTQNSPRGALFGNTSAPRRPEEEFSPRREAYRAQIAADVLREVADISELDRTIRTPRDLAQHEDFGRMREYVRQGSTLLEAYKRANLDRLFAGLAEDSGSDNR